MLRHREDARDADWGAPMSQWEHADTLRLWRTERNMTQQEVADAVGRGVSAVRGWERGRATPPPQALARMAAVWPDLGERIGISDSVVERLIQRYRDLNHPNVQVDDQPSVRTESDREPDQGPSRLRSRMIVRTDQTIIIVRPAGASDEDWKTFGQTTADLVEAWWLAADAVGILDEVL